MEESHNIILIQTQNNICWMTIFMQNAHTHTHTQTTGKTEQDCLGTHV